MATTLFATRGYRLFGGSGSPEGVVTGNVGWEYVDSAGGAKYIKQSGAGTNTGWATSGGSGASGPAGGVLSGTYPNPGFAVDMATQAELDAVAVRASLARGFLLMGA